MRKSLIGMAAAVLAASSAAALERGPVVHATPPILPHPLPQGVPYFVVGAKLLPVVQLRYGVVNGRRVLADPDTGRIVYKLNP